jgi:ApaG protein
MWRGSVRLLFVAMEAKGPSEVVTRDIRVVATPYYIPDESDPGERLFMFGYNISITNEGPVAVQLLTRHWIVIDAVGRREEVKGAGVIGQTPTLQPGETFKYQSFCPLRTNWGTMEGSYHMHSAEGGEFDIQVARFFLVVPKETLG